MRQLLIIFICCFSMQIFSQEQEFAFQYFRNGDYEKAASIYKSLHKKHPYNTTYFKYLIDCYQQLDRFDEVHTIVLKQLEAFPVQEHLYVELGYNFQLQHAQNEADSYYEKALSAIENSPNTGYLIGYTFQENHLLNRALLAFKKAMQLNPNANYNMQIARIYGEKAEIEKMFDTYLSMVDKNENHISNIKNYIGKFVNDDPEYEHNRSLKRLLLKRSQNNPKNSWNQLLSWLFMQQKEFGKALIQEKALYKRNPGNLSSIIAIGEVALNEKDYSTATSCFNFVLEQSNDTESILIAKLNLLEIDVETNDDISDVEAKFQQLFNEYGLNINTLSVQIAYSDFLTFKKDEPQKALSVLKRALKLPINDFQEGYIKIKLADILVFTNKFSSALIYYTQVQSKLKNHTIGQSARFKIAQTSYFRGDFDWAQSQLKVLKNSTSQLIANDALDLNLLITDNAVKDSLKIALKKYAKAELYAFQNKDLKAIDSLEYILNNYKGHPIEDEALFKQAQLFEKHHKYENSEHNYLKIIKLSHDDILVDDAHYYLAELYLNKFKQVEKAKTYYQKIIFDYPSSIFLVEARKKFRKLRGDDVN